MESLSIVTDATGEPVSVGEVREFCRIDSTREDRLLKSYTKSAVSYGENFTKRDFMPKTRKLVLDNFETMIDLPRAPLSTNSTDVTIEYINTTGAAATVDATVYVVDSDSEPGRVILAYDSEWPSIRSEKNAVRITYKTGYKLDASSNVTTPEAIKNWIKMRVNGMYQFREPVIADESLRYLRHDFVNGMLDEYIIISHESGQI